MSFTDGMCLRCTARFRREWNLPEPKKRRATFGLANGLARAAMVVLVAASFTLEARQLDDARTRGTATAPPETVLVPPAPFEEETMPALAVTNRPRRARRDAARVAFGVIPRPTPLPRPAMESIAESSDLVVAASPTIRPIAVSIVSVTDPAPAVSSSVTMASPVMESAPVAIAAITVPHAGLMNQAP